VANPPGEKRSLHLPAWAGAERSRPLLDAAWKVRLVRGAIVAAVVVGSLSGPLALLASLRPMPAQAIGQRQPPSSLGAQGFAELYVATYLSQAGEDHPDAAKGFYPNDVDLTGVAPGQLYLARTTAVAAEQQASGYWAVTVAADVLETVKGKLRPLGIRYYQVGVYSDGHGYVATSLPAEVQAPPAVSPPPLLLDAMAPPTDGDPVAGALSRFFDALLAGHGELARYVTPSSGLETLSPLPFTGITLRALAVYPPDEGATPSMAQAEVVGTDQGGHVTVLHYTLDIVQADGRWVVSRIRGATPLDGQTAPTTSTSTTNSSGPSTS
jgi:hypothetical protein